MNPFWKFLYQIDKVQKTFTSSSEDIFFIVAVDPGEKQRCDNAANKFDSALEIADQTFEKSFFYY